MTFGGKKALILLFAGDLVIFVISLGLTLVVRYGGLPPFWFLSLHIGAFSFLFAVWLLVFYIAGLYGKQAVLFKSELPRIILRTQLFNIVLAALLFFFLPQIGIAPKTNLAIYLVISLVLIFVWRLGLFPRLTKPSARDGAALVGVGPEVDELVAEVNGNPRYHLEFRVVVEPALLAKQGWDAFVQQLENSKSSLLVIDSENDAVRALLPRIYELTFVRHRCQFVELNRMYEEVFDRVPLSLLRYEWFLKHIAPAGVSIYSFCKRSIDIVGALVMGAVVLVVTPFIYVATRLEGPGPLFIVQERLGEGRSRMRVYKFRSMRFNNAKSGDWVGEEKQNNVTRVGNVLRKTSLDEFPQCINILRGELSLIGPRNDIEGLGLRLADVIPYYNARYAVKPGITGWAQINQRYEPGHLSPQSVEETKMRLAYDFYYIKNRSLALDLVIALKTAKRMFFRVSSW